MKKLITILSVACLMLCSSCNDWLNVTPQGQIEAEDLYTTTKGCNSAVGGIYYTMSSSSLFGQALSFGMMDLLAQYWDLSTIPDHFYYKATQYNYTDQNTVGVFSSAWQNLYYAITQCNAFIHYSEPYQNSISNYNLLLGEVYGLRAFAHMELFEIFGPVIHTTADLQKQAIAYRTDYNNVSQGFDTGEVVLQKAAEDLKRALELLADDPIRDPEVGREGDLNNSVLDYQDVLNFRGARMNYFCALGLMARLEMLRKDSNAAYNYATQVMDECKDIITLIDKQNIMNDNASSIYNFSTEMLGSFYVNNLYDITDTYFAMGGGYASGNKTAINIDNNRYNALRDYVYNRTPDGSTTDIRYQFWFKGNTEHNNLDFMKVNEASLRQGMSLAYYPEIPIMRLSEIYYIACEAQIGKDNTLALQYLNDIRTSRNLEPISAQNITDDATLLEYLIREARKDFIGDGRMFLIHKRLFYPIYTVAGRTINASDNIFVIPIPDNEYEFTGIEKPSQN